MNRRSYLGPFNVIYVWLVLLSVGGFVASFWITTSMFEGFVCLALGALCAQAALQCDIAGKSSE